MLINGIKFACNTCVKGHRSSNCNHIERPLFEIRKKGRPVTQCSHCRDLRKTKQAHMKCSCSNKSKTISHQKQYCYQCSESHGGISYSDLVQGTSQCTCHEMNSKIMYANSGTSTKIPDGSHIVLPSRSRGSMQHQENTFKRSTSASDVSFLGRSPRRMSRKATNRRSTMSSIEAANSTMMVSTQFQSDMLVDMQSFFLPDVASYSSCSASSSSPHSVYADMNDFIPCVDPFEFERSSDELTKLLNKVFYEQKDNHVSADMVRSATTTSTASSSSSPIHHLRHTMCGSIIPHASCSALVGQPQKESVMVTITPLSNQQQEVPQFDSHQASSSRIVTCYFGSNCVCPGCLVHPNNATLMQNSIYSNYNSDDDEQFIYPQPTMSDTMF